MSVSLEPVIIRAGGAVPAQEEPAVVEETVHVAPSARSMPEEPAPSSRSMPEEPALSAQSMPEIPENPNTSEEA